MVIQRTWAVTASVFCLVRYELDVPPSLLLPAAQQIRGSGSPDELVHHPLAAERRLHQHHPRRLGLHLADLRRAPRSPAPRAAPPAPRRPPRARRRRRACPRWPRTSGRCRGSPPRPATAGLHRHVALAHDHRHARRARQLVEHRGDAAARRVAHAAQRRAGGLEQRVDRRPQRARVGLDRRASSSNSPRASMIAVPCSPIVPETRIRSPGRERAGRQRRARVDRADAGGAEVHLVGVAALDDLGVAGDDLDAGRARRPRAIASTSARSTSAAQALLEHQREAERERPRARRRRGR